MLYKLTNEQVAQMARRVFVKLKGMGSIPRLGVFIFSNKFAAYPMHNILNAYHAPSDLSQWIIRETNPTPWSMHPYHGHSGDPHIGFQYSL